MKRETPKAWKRAAYWIWNLVGMNAYFRHKNVYQIRVFALHGVGDYEGTHEWLPLRPQMDAKHLRRALKILSAQYQFISMDEATAILVGNKPPMENVAVLTFDDGYLNNFTQALPVLEELGIPGIFYIATGVVESRTPFWFDRLDYVLQVAAKYGVEFELAGRLFRFDSRHRPNIAAEYADLRAHCKKNYPDDEAFTKALSDLAADLEQKTGVSLQSVLEGDEWASIVSTRDIQKYAQEDLVLFGGHSVSHLRLSCSTLDKVREELTESKQKIENWSDRPCEHFAYPNGDYDEASADVVRETGFRSAVTSDLGFNDIGADVYTLKRLHIAVDWNKPELLARASGLELTVTRCTSAIKRLIKWLQPN